MKNKQFFYSFVLLLTFLFFSCQKELKPLELAPIFGDNMVLQANTSVNIWGKATPGQTIFVEVNEQSQQARADKQGKWKLSLEAENYGKASGFKVFSGKDTLWLNNVLFGEVWLCSGQSNMEMPLVSSWAKVNNADLEVKDAQNHPDIRFFTVGNNMAFSPVDTINTDGWLVCNSDNVQGFSATAYFFGRKIQRELGIPVGLIHSSWGGTVAEAWTSLQSLENLEDFAEQALKISKMEGSKDSLQAKYDREMTLMQQEILGKDPGFVDGVAIFAGSEYDDKNWMPFTLPGMWEETDLGNYDGSTWFRNYITLNEEDIEKELSLSYGAVDDYDEVWVNGVKVGESKVWGKTRTYEVPRDVVKAGENVITIRIYDYTGDGGFMGEESDYYFIIGKEKSLPLVEGWVAKKGFDFKDIQTHPESFENPNQPTVLYNAMINPLIPFTFKGAIWYQGESNAGRAFQYRKLFRTMIQDWRARFDNGDFPFYFVQLANFHERNAEPQEDNWAELREAQTMALELPNTGMAVAIDIGDAGDIHPHNKQDVGKRLALNALAKTYGKEMAYMGPLYKSFQIKDDEVFIAFDFGQDMTTTDGGNLTGFSIAGQDSVFVWADARILEEKVVVSKEGIENPLAVRYAWSSNPECNLTNSSGLPASPFRTDDWKGITQ